MTEAELRKLILAFEDERIERTRAFDKADKMGQAICAFANDISVVTKANRELEKNGNPLAQFDINKLTEFRVTIMARSENNRIKWPDKPECGTTNAESGTTNAESGATNAESGAINAESGTINAESGTMTVLAKTYDIGSQDKAVLKIVGDNPGIKKDRIFLIVQTSLRSVQRTLERLESANKIEYRGSKRTGGWFVKT